MVSSWIYSFSFNHRNRPANPPTCFKVSEHNHGIAEVTHIDRGLHGAHEFVLGQNDNCHHTELVQVAQQLMHLKHEKAFIRHRIKITVQAINNYNAGVVMLDGSTDNVSGSR